MYLDLRVVGLSAWSGKNKNRLKIRFSIQQTSRLYLARCTSHPCIYYQSIISIFLPKNQINVKLLRIMRFSLEFRLFFHRYFCFLSYSSGFCFYFFFVSSEVIRLNLDEPIRYSLSNVKDQNRKFIQMTFKWSNKTE